MTSAPHDPFRLPVRILALGGLAGLAALTLMPQGATRMFATPWTWLLAGVLAAPPSVLLLRLCAGERPLRLPSFAWSVTALVAGTTALLSALLSPYRGPSLLSAAGLFSSTCLFLIVYDWLLADEPRRRPRLEYILAAGAAATALVSGVQWFRSILSLERAELLSSAVFHMRNPHPLGHANYTAGLMLLGLPWLGWLAWRSRGLVRGVALAATALALLNLFMSGSRGGLLGLAALGVAGVAVAGPGRKRFFLVAGGAILAAALLAVANPRIRLMLGPTDPTAEPNLSTVQRTAMLQAGLQMGRERPLLGWGPGTTPLAYPRYRHTLDGGAENVLQLHSTPLHLWAETGAAGLLAAILLGGLVAANWRRSPVAATAFAGYGVFALTDYQLDVPVFAATVATLGALLATPSAQPAPRPTRLGLGLTAAAAVGLTIILGARDRTPILNAEALTLARSPAQHAQAVALLNESFALNPDQEIAHFNLGWLLLVPDPARAEQHFLRAARLVPDKGGVYFGLGLARLNQGRNADAARAFALECLNDPRFLASPWWTVPEIAAQRETASREYDSMLSRCLTGPETPSIVTWWQTQAGHLRTLAPRLGQVSPGPENNYRRERLGYPVLMRNQDIAAPVDLYDVREDPRFPASVPFPLPSKGWLPSPRLLKLLDDPAP